MKKMLLFGTILACFLMLMIPNVSAVEYQNIKESNETYLMETIDDLDRTDLKNIIKNIDTKDVNQKIMEKIFSDNPEPAIVITLLFIVIAVIATALATLSAGLMLLLLNFLQIAYQVLGSIIDVVGQVILWVIDLIIP